MKEYKSVKEVCELTGLTRKLLHDYDVENIVKPSKYRSRSHVDKRGREYDAYKMYDEVAVVKLQQVAIFRKLKMKRCEIKERMTAVNYDVNRILEEQIQMLNKEKEEIENLLVVAEQLKAIGMKSELTQCYASMSFEEIMKSSFQWESSGLSNKFCEILEKPSKEFADEIELVLDELFAISVDECVSEKAIEVVEELFQIIKNHYGFAGWFGTLTLAICGQGEGEIVFELSEVLDKKVVLAASKAVIHYIKKDMEIMWDEIIEVMNEFYDVIGKSYNYERVGEMVENIKNLLQTHLGLVSKEDYMMFFEIIRMTPLMGEKNKIGFVLSAVEYYSK